MTLIGYLDHLSVSAGSSLDCMLSSTDEDVTLDVVRLLHGDTNPAGPGAKSEAITGIPAQHVAGGLQGTYLGSCVVVPDIGSQELDGLRLTVLIQPTLPEAGRTQGIVSFVAADSAPVLGVEITRSGALAVRGADDNGAVICELDVSWRRGVWYRIVIEIREGRVELECATQASFGTTSRTDRVNGSYASATPITGLVVGARSCERMERQWRPIAGFNGKIEHPVIDRIGDEAAGTIGDWQFELSPQADHCDDVSGHSHHGVVVNAPMRGAKGHSWSGRVVDFTIDPEQYGAIHFHEDDLDDAGWSVNATIQVPPDLPSGVYAARLRAGDAVDHIPFVVTPGPNARRARVAVLLPTFTYIAYGNERMVDRLDFEGEQMTDHPILPGFHDRELARHPEWGLSLYDVHSDGSTCVHSTHLRPIPNLRPDYRNWLQNAPRHLGADLYLVDWLTEMGLTTFDVLTDHDLNSTGSGLLDGYDLVITGSHPEYVSETILDSLEHHVSTAGSLMYLGGNGFYWVTSQDPKRPHLIEVRRGPVGTRPSEGAPGEGVHSTTGEPGGLWRQRGRGPNQLTGVGMTAQGWDQKAPGYARMPDSSRPEAAFVFRGINDDEVIGDFGLIMDGASGDEIDRFDLDRGSPAGTLVLARSTGHSDYYQLAGEDVLASRAGLGGTESPEVRSDMTLIEHESGAGVFSVGSICFTGSLSHNGYQNNVSRLIENVVREFLARGGTARHATTSN